VRQSALSRFGIRVAFMPTGLLRLLFQYTLCIRVASAAYSCLNCLVSFVTPLGQGDD
jgi:hypothetical protein